MPYEQRYCDANSDLENFTLRNVIVVVLVHVQLQFSSRELAIKPKSLSISGRGISPQRVEGMTHTEKDPCMCALNCLASVER